VRLKIIYTILLLVSLSIQSYAQVELKPVQSLFIGYPTRIHVLDSLINIAPTFALNKADYDDAFQHATKAGATADSLLQQVAHHFFNDLAYGNRVPKLEYEGAKYNVKAYEVSNLVQTFAQQNNLASLPNYFLSNSKEVAIILDSLHYYQDSLHLNKDKLVLLEKAANEFRWLSAIKMTNRIILVNIPSTLLKAYDSNKLVMSMRVVVGKSWTKTNTLSSQVKQIVLNPYWHVPVSIIKKEMIPNFKNDSTYFSKHNYTVIDQSGKAVDLSSMDISSYSQSNFPFSIRQGTGAYNSLGLLKIEFDSPSAIYLHDSPQKKLFKNTSRFYSHGCVRLEKPIELGKWLLQDNRKEIDSFDFQHPEKYSKPQYVVVKIPTQVIIWYSIIDFDNEGVLKFYKNIYQKK
jgi:lipoprotein-anchoring transpeptidase ErfK/SrfK